MIGLVTWPPLYVQRRWPSDQANHIVTFLASAGIKVFGCIYLPIYNDVSDWPHTFFTSRVFLLSISLLFGSINTCYYLYIRRTQYCKLNFEA